MTKDLLAYMKFACKKDMMESKRRRLLRYEDTRMNRPVAGPKTVPKAIQFSTELAT